MRTVLLLAFLRFTLGIRTVAESSSRLGSEPFADLSPEAASFLGLQNLHAGLASDTSINPQDYEQKIAEYSAAWQDLGIEVEVWNSAEELMASRPTPWKSPGDKEVAAGDQEDRPRCSGGVCEPVRIDEVVPFLKLAPYLYHGGDVTAEQFANGIDFQKSRDRITGPAFFTSHNVYYALIYGARAAATWGSWHSENATLYRLALEIKLQELDQCVGLVPDMDFLQQSSNKGPGEVGDFVESQCASQKCAFIAVNWNEDGQLGSGWLPYEIRLLPGSLEACRPKISKVLMVKSTHVDPFFYSFNTGPNVQAAWRNYHTLMTQSMALRPSS